MFLFAGLGWTGLATNSSAQASIGAVKTTQTPALPTTFLILCDILCTIGRKSNRTTAQAAGAAAGPSCDCLSSVKHPGEGEGKFGVKRATLVVSEHSEITAPRCAAAAAPAA